jgi:DNA-directed RNA polymerase beta' subunit
VDKETYLKGVCTQIEQDKRGRTRDLFKKIKEITGKFKPRLSVIRDKNDMEKTEGGEVKERWIEYTQQLYKQDVFMKE